MPQLHRLLTSTYHLLRRETGIVNARWARTGALRGGIALFFGQTPLNDRIQRNASLATSSSSPALRKALIASSKASMRVRAIDKPSIGSSSSPPLSSAFQAQCWLFPFFILQIGLAQLLIKCAFVGFFSSNGQRLDRFFPLARMHEAIGQSS